MPWINIITRKAGDKPGLRISGGTGTEDRGFGNVSYSSSMGNADYRVYAMQEYRDGGLTPLTSHKLAWGYQPNKDMPDSRHMSQQGFRLDWDADALTRVSLHGDAYQVHAGSSMYWMPTVVVNNLGEYTHKNSYSGKNLVLHVEQQMAPDVLFKGQLFFDQYKLHRQMMREEKNTFDADVQFDIADVFGQDISVGGNLRLMRSRNHNTPQFYLPGRATQLSSLFVNDEVRFHDDFLRVNAGVKMERNSFTSWETQPSARAIIGDDRWALWTSASQAVRTPNDMENGLSWALRTTGGKVLKQIGSGVAGRERVTSYELGGRFRPDDRSLVEVATFRIFYDGVLDTWQNRSPTNPYVLAGVIPEYLTNVLNGKADGVEANFRFNPWDWMTLKGSYTYLHQLYNDYPVKDGETKWTVLSVKAQDPANRFHVGLGLGAGERARVRREPVFHRSVPGRLHPRLSPAGHAPGMDAEQGPGDQPGRAGHAAGLLPEQYRQHHRLCQLDPATLLSEREIPVRLGAVHWPQSRPIRWAATMALVRLFTPRLA